MSTAQFLSRFADPRRTTPVDLGPCRCPGSPHERDSATVRAEIGEGELRSALAAGLAATGGAWYDGAAGDSESLARFTTSWTLLDEKGEPVPLSRAQADLLDEPTRDALLAAIADGVTVRQAVALPLGSGAPSADSSPASASPIPTTLTPG